MEYLDFSKESILKIYISELDKAEGKPLYEFIMYKAKEFKLSGITIYKGIMGYGRHFHIHTDKILTLSENLPIIIEIVDEEKRLIEFIQYIKDYIKEGIISLEDVRVMRIRD